jgi:hypothetical protein
MLLGWLLCYEKKLIKSLAELVCYACSFLRYSPRLQKEHDKIIVMEGFGKLQALALEMHRRTSSNVRL